MLRSDGAGGDLISCGETRTAAVDDDDDDDAATVEVADLAAAAEEEEGGTTPVAARVLKRRNPAREEPNERMPGTFVRSQGCAAGCQ